TSSGARASASRPTSTRSRPSCSRSRSRCSRSPSSSTAGRRGGSGGPRGSRPSSRAAAETKGVLRMRELDFTLTAGPTEASPGTLAALGAPITYHYDPLFLEDYRDAERKVAQVFRTRSDVLLLQGEAVLGLEAAARALVRPGMHCLNVT